MKTYSVELKRVSYLTYVVEADDEDDAQDKAWDMLANEANTLRDYASWDVESVLEHEQE